MVCEDCLGPNPYIRMQRQDYAAECAISGRPFTVFRWRPGTEARYKKTVVCKEIALAKNVCQVCLLDLDYGIPVQARDAALGREAANNETALMGAKSDVNIEYQTEQIARRIANGEDVAAEASGLAAGGALVAGGAGGGAGVGALRRATGRHHALVVGIALGMFLTSLATTWLRASFAAGAPPPRGARPRHGHPLESALPAGAPRLRGARPPAARALGFPLSGRHKFVEFCSSRTALRSWSSSSIGLLAASEQLF